MCANKGHLCICICVSVFVLNVCPHRNAPKDKGKHFTRDESVTRKGGKNIAYLTDENN